MFLGINKGLHGLSLISSDKYSKNKSCLYSLFIAPQLLSCHPRRNNLHNTLHGVTMQTV